MNYRHAFHAGNFADVVKHLALIAVLQYLQRKPKPFAVIDTHAGCGAYDMKGAEARLTGEAEAGVRRLIGLQGDALMTRYLEICARCDVYPGSPLIAAQFLRESDRLVAVEKHPEEAAMLTEVLRPYPKARAAEADGYTRLITLVPPHERRGVILIDPPFEETNEFVQSAKAFSAAYRRFATGIYLLWFPVKSASEADRFCGEVLNAGVDKVLRLDIQLDPVPEDRLAAAGLVVVNPPYGFVAQMQAALEPALPRLGAKLQCRWLAGSE